MEKRLTRWTAVFLLLGAMAFLGGCSGSSTTGHPEKQKETAGAGLRPSRPARRHPRRHPRPCTGRAKGAN